MSALSVTFRRASRTFVVAAFGVLVLLGATHVAAGTRADRLTYLTFARPVALPGVTLAPGTYAFEVANPNSSADVVLVRDRARMRTFYSGFTHRVPRPAGFSETRPVRLGEAAAGGAAPILAWYPVDNEMGHEFIYRR